MPVGPTSSRKASGTVGIGTRPSFHGGKPPTSHLTKLSESGAVDHLDGEVVRDLIESLRDVHRYSYCSARGLKLVESRDHPSRSVGAGLRQWNASV